ncbi:hypothetical protein T08_9451 [Trichinella sp. T8]|nr:hypothetical protein T08_9451 [Trichinella sp. T8]
MMWTALIDNYIGSCGGNERVIQSQMMWYRHAKGGRKLAEREIPSFLKLVLLFRVFCDKHWREPQANGINGVNFNRLIKR